MGFPNINFRFLSQSLQSCVNTSTCDRALSEDKLNRSLVSAEIHRDLGCAGVPGLVAGASQLAL